MKFQFSIFLAQSCTVPYLNVEPSKDPVQLLLGLLLHDHPTLRVLQLVVGAGLGHSPTDDDLLSVQL